MKIHRIIVTVAAEDKLDEDVLIGVMQKGASDLKIGRFLTTASVTGSDHRHVDYPDPTMYSDIEIEEWLGRAEDAIFGL